MQNSQLPHGTVPKIGYKSYLVYVWVIVLVCLWVLLINILRWATLAKGFGLRLDWYSGAYSEWEGIFWLLHMLLVLSTFIWVIYNGMTKRAGNILAWSFSSFLVLYILDTTQQADWWYPCIDFCWFWTVFLVPIVHIILFFVFLFASLAAVPE